MKYYDPICGRAPEEIPEFVQEAEVITADLTEAWKLRGAPQGLDEEGQPIDGTPRYTASDFVRDEEGTFDPVSGQYLCTLCYIKVGMPSAERGWLATPQNIANLHVALAIPKHLDSAPAADGS